MKEIQNLRVDYSGEILDIKELNKNPLNQFKVWFNELKTKNVIEPNAMILSTISKKNTINSRTVLLKDISDKGFVFYTNYESKKGEDINYNKNVSAVFLWKKIERQVIIKGIASKISSEESKKYFDSRPRKSRIVAWASKQSRNLKNSDQLIKSFNFYNKKFKGQEIPLPRFWGGYLIKPSSVEFWQGRSSRMHDRVLYERKDNEWNISKLYP
jgi:pyridoxamine 5'-phosphate oxidase